MVVLAVTGFTSELFLEGCFRAHDPETQDVRYLLSSGTEDCTSPSPTHLTHSTHSRFRDLALNPRSAP